MTGAGSSSSIGHNDEDFRMDPKPTNYEDFVSPFFESENATFEPDDVNGTSNGTAPRYFLNITLSSPIEYAVPLGGYAMPVLILITIIANTLVSCLQNICKR